MKIVEIAIDDLQNIEVLGDEPLYRFEELLNETSRNDLRLVLNGHLNLGLNYDDIDDYEIKEDSVVLYIDDKY